MLSAYENKLTLKLFVMFFLCFLFCGFLCGFFVGMWVSNIFVQNTAVKTLGHALSLGLWLGGVFRVFYVIANRLYNPPYI